MNYTLVRLLSCLVFTVCVIQIEAGENKNPKPDVEVTTNYKEWSDEFSDDFEGVVEFQEDNDVPTTYKEWSSLNNKNEEIFHESDIVQNQQKFASKSDQNQDITIEEYIKALENAGEIAFQSWHNDRNNDDVEDLISAYNEAFGDLAHDEKYYTRDKTVQTTCNHLEYGVARAQIEAYKQRLRKNKIRVTEAEFINVLQSLGFSKENLDIEVEKLHHESNLITYDIDNCIKQKSHNFFLNSWYGKAAIIATGAATLYTIYDYCKQYCAKRKQETRAKTVTTQKIIVFEIR